MSNNAPSLGQLNLVIQNLVSILLPFAAIACVVMVVMSGFSYFSAGGDKEGTVRAQRTLTYAFGGLVLTISAWLILSLFGQFLGIPVGQFNICLPNQNC